MSTVKPPLTLPLMRPVTISFFSSACSSRDHRALGLLARQHGFAEAVLDAVEGDLHFVADGDVDLAAVVTELFDRHDAFGLQAGVDHHDVGADVHDAPHDDRAGLDFLAGQALFEQFRKTLGHEYFRDPLGPLFLAVFLHGQGAVDSNRASRAAPLKLKNFKPWKPHPAGDVLRPAPAHARPPHRSSSPWNPRSRRRRRAAAGQPRGLRRGDRARLSPAKGRRG